MPLRQAARIVDKLPPQGLEELGMFLEFLEYKYQDEPHTSAVALGGMWRELAFDVTDEDVRALRREIT